MAAINNRLSCSSAACCSSDRLSSVVIAAKAALTSSTSVSSSSTRRVLQTALTQRHEHPTCAEAMRARGRRLREAVTGSVSTCRRREAVRRTSHSAPSLLETLCDRCLMTPSTTASILMHRVVMQGWRGGRNGSGEFGRPPRRDTSRSGGSRHRRRCGRRPRTRPAMALCGAPRVRVRRVGGWSVRDTSLVVRSRELLRRGSQLCARRHRGTTEP